MTISKEDPESNRYCCAPELDSVIDPQRLANSGALIARAKFYSSLHLGARGMPLPPNVLAELQRDMARLGLVIG